VRDLQLGKDVPVQQRKLKLQDHSSRRQREGCSLGAQWKPLQTLRPPNVHTTFLLLSLFKDRN
jgi:hypothetical protein